MIFPIILSTLLLQATTTAAQPVTATSAKQTHSQVDLDALLPRELSNTTSNSAFHIRAALGCHLPQKSLSTKKGVSYPRDQTRYANYFNRISWAYNWYHAAKYWSPNAASLNGNIDYVPMIHSNKPDITNTWNQDIDGLLKGREDLAILAFNEPDMPINAGGSDMSPETAVELYRKYILPYACRARLGAPAVSNSPAAVNKGVRWLQRFLMLCTDCVIDFIPVHAYGPPTDIQMFKNAITGAYMAGGDPARKVWVTEFAHQVGSNPPIDQKKNLMRELSQWMNQQDFVERYAWWSADQGNLINGDGSGLSELGQYWNLL
ncbi:hypothetical protein BT63DRAFT_467932 [Microthyrium microscopicum]|uniref:Asl1-like glycosyl hydrolase catalytic domain-containing protein n=1 Tax=Microthyrium microscopicum TaxID=703497 RepID=A0A6A6UHU0_9PEZI|nr:hypothetical protein BT63DRAFT_467932 [Microthyrium microscopicum]